MRNNLQNIAQGENGGNYFQALVATMRLNLLWFIPLSLWIVDYFVLPNARSGYQNILLGLHRFTWGVLFSPSAYLFLAAVFESLYLPIQLLFTMPIFFVRDAPRYKRRYILSFCTAIAIAVSAILLQFVIVGSFPLPLDKDGYIHLRLIPFFPWPDWSQPINWG